MAHPKHKPAHEQSHASTHDKTHPSHHGSAGHKHGHHADRKSHSHLVTVPGDQLPPEAQQQVLDTVSDVAASLPPTSPNPAATTTDTQPANPPAPPPADAKTSANPSILETIVNFFKFMLYCLHLDGKPYTADEESSQTRQASYTERLSTFEKAISSGAAEKWADFQHRHSGEAVNFCSPVEGNSRVTSGFGDRTPPRVVINGVVHHGSANHPGVDIGTLDKTPPHIIAPADGIVLFAGPYGGYGNAVMLGHADGSWTLYGHLSQIDVAMGDEVDQKKIIGLMGSEGISTGLHLHYGHFKDNSPVAPVVDGKQLAMGTQLRSTVDFAKLAHPDQHAKLPVTDGTIPPTAFNGKSPAQPRAALG